MVNERELFVETVKTLANCIKGYTSDVNVTRARAADNQLDKLTEKLEKWAAGIKPSGMYRDCVIHDDAISFLLDDGGDDHTTVKISFTDFEQMTLVMNNIAKRLRKD